MVERGDDVDARIRSLYQAGKSLQDVGTEVQLSKSTVAVRLARMGIETRKGRPPAVGQEALDTELIKSLYVELGWGLLRVASEVGATRAAVERALANAGVPIRRRGRPRSAVRDDH